MVEGHMAVIQVGSRKKDEIAMTPTLQSKEKKIELDEQEKIDCVCEEVNRDGNVGYCPIHGHRCPNC